MNLSIELNDRQADVMWRALELWARIGTGELTALLGHPEVSRRLVTDTGVTTENVRRSLEYLKQAVFNLPHGAEFGIANPDIHESNRIAYDLMQALRHHLAWSRAGNPPKRTPEMFSIVYDEPLRISTEPLPVVREQREVL
jgi:hypothetical protein